MSNSNKVEPMAGDTERIHENPIEDDEETERLNEPPQKANNLARVMYLEKRDANNQLMKIDYVLGFRVRAVEENATAADGDKDKIDDELRLNLKEKLEANEFVVEYIKSSDSGDKRFGYMLLHGKFALMTKYAEAVKLEMALKRQQEDRLVDVVIPRTCHLDFMTCFRNDEDSAQKQDLFTAPFQEDRIDMFLHDDDPINFFTSAQRSLLVHSALREISIYSEALASGAITDSYPLHDGPFELAPNVNPKAQGYENDRQELYDIWVRAKNFYKFQPLLLIRRYFGEKISMYYAWLGYYNMWLLPVSLLGIGVIVYGLVTLGNNTPGNEICEPNGTTNQLFMCPLCDKVCDYWRLGDSCLYSRIVYVFDNEATILFSILMSLWATCFLEFWTRRQHVLQYEWDVNNYEQEELPRPEYTQAIHRRLIKKNIKPGTREDIEMRYEADKDVNFEDSNDYNYKTELDRGLPFFIRLPRYCVSFGTVMFMVCLVLALLVGVIVYRITMIMVFSSLNFHNVLTSNVRVVTSITAAGINFIVILILNFVYRSLAIYLTDLEQPKTETSYEDSYTLKVYCFQFVNYYSSLIYIAFFKGYFHGRPGHYNRAWGARIEECDPAGCLVELVIQMLIIFVAKQVLSNFMEFFVPTLRNCVLQRRFVIDAEAPPKEDPNLSVYSTGKDLKPWEKESFLSPVNHLQLFDEYLELVIQFGFVTLFVASMPLAPLFALLNNIFEVRLDAMKMVKMLRRPLARRTSDIGIWMYILSSISAISVVSNAFIIGFTSEQIPKMVYRYTNGNNSLSGYMKWRLSQFAIRDFENSSMPNDATNNTICYYRDFRNPPNHSDAYEYTQSFWHILAARLTFILVYEHLVLFLKGLIDWLVPDMPIEVKAEIKKEKNLFRLALFRKMKNKTKSEPQLPNPNASNATYQNV